MSIVTLLTAIIILVALFYVIRLIPDATIQKVAQIILVVVALFWIVRNMSALLHCCTGP